MTTLAAGSSITFGLSVDQTFELTTTDGTTGTISLDGPFGSPMLWNFGPERRNNWKPISKGLSGALTLTCTAGSVSYTLGNSVFVTATTDDVTGAISIPSGGSVAEFFGASPSATAAANATAINAALACSWYVTLTLPGTYLIGSALVIPSNTEFHIAKGVTLKLADAANCNLIRNTHALDAGTVVTITSSSYTATVAWAGHGKAVGSYISIIGSTSKGYNGVWRIDTIATDTFTYTLDSLPAATTAAGTIKAVVADTNITVSGEGVLDGNSAGQTFSNVISANCCVLLMMHARFIRLTDYAGLVGAFWHTTVSAAEDVLIRNHNYDLGRTLGKDAIHLEGPWRRVHVEHANIRSGDNVIGMTINRTADWVSTSAPYPFTSGDCYDLTMKDVNADTQAAAVAWWGCPGFGFYGMQELDGLHGVSTSKGVQLAAYSAGGFTMSSVVGGTLSLKNITIKAALQSIVMAAQGNWDRVLIENVEIATSNQQGLDVSQTSGTIGYMRLSNFKYVGAAARGAATIQFGTATINAVDVCNCQDHALGSQYWATAGAATIKKITFDGCVVSTTAALFYPVGALVCDQIIFNNCGVYGTGSAGVMLKQNTGTLFVSVYFNNCFANAASALFFGANTTQTINVSMNNVELTSCANAGVFAGPTNLSVVNYKEITAMTNNPFQALTTATAYNFKFQNVNSLKTDLINFTAGANLRMQGGFTAGGNVTAANAVPGDVFYDITAARTKLRDGGGATFTTLGA